MSYLFARVCNEEHAVGLPRLIICCAYNGSFRFPVNNTGRIVENSREANIEQSIMRYICERVSIFTLQNSGQSTSILIDVARFILFGGIYMCLRFRYAFSVQTGTILASDGISWTNRAVKIFTLLTDHLAHHSNLSEASRATMEQFRREMGENKSRRGEVALTGFWRGSTIREVFTIHFLHLSSVSRRERKKERERETRDSLKLHRSRKDQNINHAQHLYNMSY